jgi:hypothetical protein
MLIQCISQWKQTTHLKRKPGGILVKSMNYDSACLVLNL